MEATTAAQRWAVLVAALTTPELTKGLTANAKLLCAFITVKSPLRTSIRGLAKLTGQARNTARDALRDLESFELVEVKQGDTLGDMIITAQVQPWMERLVEGQKPTTGCSDIPPEKGGVGQFLTHPPIENDLVVSTDLTMGVGQILTHPGSKFDPGLKEPNPELVEILLGYMTGCPEDAQKKS